MKLLSLTFEALGNDLNWNEKIVWIVECEELVNVCSSVKCEGYKRIGDFLEGSDIDVEFKCDNCLIQKRNRTKVESSCREKSWGGETV